MNLEAAIRPDLWKAIQTSYEAGNYTHAVRDAIHILTDVIRDKSGLDGDGHQLVGQAFGGNTPRLKINKFQTESERNEQKGFEHLLRGVYMGIRNPRSHEHHAQIQDNKDTADKIIVFVDYLIGVLADSKPPFTIAEFITRVFDPYFVLSKRYAELLVADIPDNKLVDCLTEVFRLRTQEDEESLPFVFSAIRSRLRPDQLDAYLAIVSDEMLITKGEAEVRTIFKMLEPDLWPRLSESARLRVEKIMLQSIAEGIITFDIRNPARERTIGALGTWCRDYAGHFIQKSQVWSNLHSKLLSKRTDEQLYVLTYFATALPQVCEDDFDDYMMLDAIVSALRSDLSFESRRKFLDLVDRAMSSYTEDWQKHILDQTAEFRLVSDEDPPF